jgi:hypothetical protein
MDALAHLFLPDHWHEDYGGIPLNSDSTPSDLAHNIYEFIQYRNPDFDPACPINEESEMTKVKTKVINLQNYYHETDQYGDLPQLQA